MKHWNIWNMRQQVCGLAFRAVVAVAALALGLGSVVAVSATAFAAGESDACEAANKSDGCDQDTTITVTIPADDDDNDDDDDGNDDDDDDDANNNSGNNTSNKNTTSKSTTSGNSSTSNTSGYSGDTTGTTSTDISRTSTEVPDSDSDDTDAAATTASEPVRVDHIFYQTRGKVKITATGFDPNEKVQVVLFSDPVLVGSYDATDKGEFELTVALPDGFEAGKHNVQLTGWQSKKIGVADFILTTMSYTVEQDSATWPTWLFWLLAILLLLLLAYGMWRAYKAIASQPSSEVAQGVIAGCDTGQW